MRELTLPSHLAITRREVTLVALLTQTIALFTVHQHNVGYMAFKKYNPPCLSVLDVFCL